MKAKKAELKNAKKKKKIKTTVGKVQNALTQATDWVGNLTKDKVVATSTESGKKLISTIPGRETPSSGTSRMRGEASVNKTSRMNCLGIEDEEVLVIR